MIKIGEICNRGYNFVQINSGFATDYAVNAVAPSFSGPMTPTEKSVQDVVTGPIVVSFGLDLPSGILSLMFVEPVWLILPSEIVIPDAVNSTATYTLTTYIPCTISSLNQYKHHS